jgi:hypothetical protein
MIYDVLVGRYLRLCMSILGCSIARRYIPNGTWVTGRTRDCGLLLHFDHMQTIWLQRLATDSNTTTFTSRRAPVLSTCRTHGEDCFLCCKKAINVCFLASHFSGFQGYLPRATLHRLPLGDLAYLHHRGTITVATYEAADTSPTSSPQSLVPQNWLKCKFEAGHDA